MGFFRFLPSGRAFFKGKLLGYVRFFVICRWNLVFEVAVGTVFVGEMGFLGG